MTARETKRIRGVLAPVVTPFNADWSVNVELLVEHCSALIADGAGLALFGTNSEAASIPIRERIIALETLVHAGIPPNLIMPGTGCCSIEESVTLTSHAVDLGIGSVLVMPPFFYKEADQAGLLRYFGTVIERVAAPVSLYLYNIPQYTQVPITANLVDELLSRYPESVAGLKDSSGDWSNTSLMLEMFAGRGFDVFCASEIFLTDTLDRGGAGCISATANVNARGIGAVIEHAGRPSAEAAQQAATAVRRVFQSRAMIAAMKHFLSVRYAERSWQAVKPPLSPLSPELIAPLMSELKAIGFE